jgi:hypothetical protein
MPRFYDGFDADLRINDQGVVPSRLTRRMMRSCTSASEVKSMRTVLFNSAVIVGVVWMGTAPADAAPPSMSGIGNTSIQVATVERVGYRRYYRRYGYPVPYAYYPPPYGYYVPPPAYAYPPPAYAGAPPDGDYGEAPPEGEYADAPPPDGDYADAPPPEGDYGNDGDYADAPPPVDY